MMEDKNGNHKTHTATGELKAEGSTVTAVVTIVKQLVAVGVPEDYAEQLPRAIEEDKKSGTPSLESPRVKKWRETLESSVMKGIGLALAAEVAKIIQHAIDLLR